MSEETKKPEEAPVEKKVRKERSDKGKPRGPRVPKGA